MHKNWTYHQIIPLIDQLKILNSFYKYSPKLSNISKVDRNKNYSIGFYLNKNWEILIKETFFYILELLKKHYKLRINPSIISDEYDLNLINIPKQPFFIYDFQFQKKFLWKSADEAQKIKKKYSYFWWLEVLELFLLNPGFYNYFIHKLWYAYILTNTYLTNKQNILDNKRCLCMYGVWWFFVIDRVSTKYQVPRNNSLLINPIYIQ